MLTAPRCLWRLRSFRLAYVLMVVACTSCHAAFLKETKAAAPPGFVVLEGPAALQFLIGKTIVAPVDSFNLQEARYFIDASTVLDGFVEPGRPLMEGLKTGRTCFIRPWKFTNTEDCGDQSGLSTSKTKCVPFRMLAANQSAKSSTGQPGALRGYYRLDYLAGKSDLPLSKDRSSRIVEGNVTGCPSARLPTSFDPIELSEMDNSIALEPPAPFKDGKVSPAALVERALIGKSLVFPKVDGADCPQIDYLSPDGVYYSLNCSARVSAHKRLLRLSDRPTITLVTSRWKRVGDHFCFENDNADGIFNHCDTILVSAFPAPAAKGSGSVKRLHAFYIFNATQTVPSADKPALIVRGNPAGFRFNP